MRLVTLDAPLGAAGVAAIALALSAGVTRTRLTAVDAVAATLHGGHVRAGDLAAPCAAQVTAGVAKVNRLATSLDELRNIRPEWVRELAMATAAALVDHRDVAKLLVVASEAAAVAGGARVPPPLNHAQPVEPALQSSRRGPAAAGPARRPTGRRHVKPRRFDVAIGRSVAACTSRAVARSPRWAVGGAGNLRRGSGG